MEKDSSAFPYRNVCLKFWKYSDCMGRRNGKCDRSRDSGRADGLEIEVHCNPEKAMSDASQQLTPQQFEELTAKLNKYAAVEGKSI